MTPPAETKPKPQPPPKTETQARAAAVGKAEVLFSPGGGCTAAIVDRINRANRSVLVQAYRLTSPQIAKALVSAKERGVTVEIILDKRQQSDRYSDATYLANRQVAVLIDHDHAISHDKVMLIDGRVIITGSFNFTQAAETSNAENVLILEECQSLATAYAANYAKHRTHAKPYEQPKAPANAPAAPEKDGEGEQAADCCERTESKIAVVE